MTLSNVKSASDLDPPYFDGSDGEATGFPPSLLSIYDQLYPIDCIICPRFKKRSWGHAISMRQYRCGCFTENTMDLLDPLYSAQHPHILQDVISVDSLVPIQAYCDVLLLFKPVKYWCSLQCTSHYHMTPAAAGPLPSPLPPPRAASRPSQPDLFFSWKKPRQSCSYASLFIMLRCR